MVQLIPIALSHPDPRLRIRPVRMSDTDSLAFGCWNDQPYEWVQKLVARAQKQSNQRQGLGIVVSVPPAPGIVAYGHITRWTRSAEISDLVVLPSHRGQGIGTSIIQYLVRVAREMTVPRVEIGAALSNPRALNLYRHVGFQDHRCVMIALDNGEEPVQYLELDLPRYH